MPLGKVKWFNNAKGYGFIIADESEDEEYCNEDLFVHFSSIQMEGYKTLKAGQAVYFDPQPSGKGYHAINIVPVEATVDTPPDVQSEATSQQPASKEPDAEKSKIEAMAS